MPLRYKDSKLLAITFQASASFRKDGVVNVCELRVPFTIPEHVGWDPISTQIVRSSITDAIFAASIAPWKFTTLRHARARYEAFKVTPSEITWPRSGEMYGKEGGR